MSAKENPSKLTCFAPKFMGSHSPLDGIKFELGVILVGAILLLVLQQRITASLTLQFLLLSGYGLAGAVWIILRARRAMGRALRNQRRYGRDAE
jgi:hypothetical protein